MAKLNDGEFESNGEGAVAQDAVKDFLRSELGRAASLVFVGLVILGFMVWQPWASPRTETVEWKDEFGKTYSTSSCITYKSSIVCGK